MIRLADIAAASSCFPSAFEPLRFPDDFLWSKSVEAIRDELGKSFTESVPLMDGGIFDNQGVDSVVRAYERGNQQVGLLIISDTTQRNPSIFEFTPEKKRGRLTVGTLVKLAWIVFLISIATTTTLIIAWRLSILADRFHLLIFFFTECRSYSPVFWPEGCGGFADNTRKRRKRVAEMTTLELWPFLKHLTMPELINLISGRIVNLSHYNVDEVFSWHRASSHSTNTQLLPDEAISRKSIYGERG